MTELKTSDEWQRENLDIIVHDPDGWDRSNFKYSWHIERITFEEYKLRRNKSTCRYIKRRGGLI